MSQQHQSKAFRISKTSSSISTKNVLKLASSFQIKTNLISQLSSHQSEKLQAHTTDPSPKNGTNSCQLHKKSVLRIYDKQNTNGFFNFHQNSHVSSNSGQTKNTKGINLLKYHHKSPSQIKTHREGQSFSGIEGSKRLDLTSSNFHFTNSKGKPNKNKKSNIINQALTAREGFSFKEKSKPENSPFRRNLKVSAIKMKLIKSIYAPVAVK